MTLAIHAEAIVGLAVLNTEHDSERIIVFRHKPNGKFIVLPSQRASIQGVSSWFVGIGAIEVSSKNIAPLNKVSVHRSPIRWPFTGSRRIERKPIARASGKVFTNQELRVLVNRDLNCLCRCMEGSVVEPDVKT